MAGVWSSGRIGFSGHPSVESLKIAASLNLPNDLGIEKTASIINKIEQAAYSIKDEFVDPKTEQP